jgi:hypothetical protein
MQKASSPKVESLSLRHIISININELRFMKRPKNPPRSLWGGHYEIPTAMARKR